MFHVKHFKKGVHTMKAKIYQVNAFSTEPFGGNPAGVVLDARGLSDVDMQNIAREMNLSETAFIIPIDEDNFNVRFFTPFQEVDLCGHATIASFYTLAYKGYIPSLYNGVKKVHQETKAGKLSVEIFFSKDKIDNVIMEQASPKDLGVIEDIESLMECFNIDKEDIGIGQEFVYPRIASTGLSDIFLPLKNKETLDNLKVDLKKLSKVSQELNVVGAHVFYLPKVDSERVYTRNFAPLVGINEEAATGTSNGALIYLLKKEGYINGNEITAMQGEVLNRPSNIYCRIDEGEDGYIVKVGGQGKIVFEGVMYF